MSVFSSRVMSRQSSARRYSRSSLKLKAAYGESLAGLGERTRVSVAVLRGGRRTTLVLDYADDTEKED